MFKKLLIISVFIGLVSCNNSKNKEIDYSALGKKYTLSTKRALGKNLMDKIKNEGTLAALAFCNSKAYFLTDSMSVVQNATIKRVSDKPRNIKNLANTEELQQIEKFKTMLLTKQKMIPFVKEEEKRIIFSAPIITDGICLQCHGTVRREMHPAVLKAIKELYPDDKAIGYDVNEVRGIWKITFQKPRSE